MSILEMPLFPAPKSVTLERDAAVEVATSPFTFQQQVFEWPGQKWKVMMEFPPMDSGTAGPWLAFFAALNGPAGIFLWRPTFQHLSGRAESPGLGCLDGVHPGGIAVNSRGWIPLASNVLRVGCLVEIGGRLRRVTTAAHSDSAGKAIFNVWPRLERPLGDGEPINFLSPAGRFRLIDEPAEGFTSDHIWNLTLGAEEAL